MGKTFDILLVEDSDADAFLTRTVIEDGELSVDLSIVKDGVEAMAFLRREKGYADAVRPNLILLDLNLPKKSGYQVLTEMRIDEVLCQIPVVVFSTSDNETDVRASYAHGANCYVTKPNRLADFRTAIHAIETFWLTTVRLPAVQ